MTCGWLRMKEGPALASGACCSQTSATSYNYYMPNFKTKLARLFLLLLMKRGLA